MRQHIEQALQALQYPDQPKGLYEPLRYVLSLGGKRLRPILLLTAYSLYRPDWTAVMDAALGIEVYHNHTLLHDDLMDRADLRRGMPTVHRRWNDNTAILSGDTMLLLAYRLIASTRCGRWDEALELFTHSAISICEGQQYDVNFETSDQVSEADYIEMIRLKTSVLLGCATKMGALLADAPDADAQCLYRFAERVGLAFQLQDDLLDAFGEVKVFGKRIGGDILCGKKTFLYHAALAEMDEAERRTFNAFFHTRDLVDEEKIAGVLKLFRRYHAKERCEERIATYFDEAQQLLDGLSVDATPLRDYAQTLIRREQ